MAYQGEASLETVALRPRSIINNPSHPGMVIREASFCGNRWRSGTGGRDGADKLEHFAAYETSRAVDPEEHRHSGAES
jgi:hypothetical protein